MIRHLNGCVWDTRCDATMAALSVPVDLHLRNTEHNDALVEVLVALTHASLAIAAILADEDNHGRRVGQTDKHAVPGHSGGVLPWCRARAVAASCY